jgi:hypothetical protein
VRLSVDQRAELERRLFEEFERAAAALGQLCRRFVEAGQAATGDHSMTSFHPADGTADEFDGELNATDETRLGRELAASDRALTDCVRPGARGRSAPLWRTPRSPSRRALRRRPSD